MVFFMIPIAFIVGIASSVVISSSLLIVGGIGVVGTYLAVIASFALSVFLAGLAAMSGALVYCAFLHLTGQPAPLFLGFIDHVPRLRGLISFATKLTYLGASHGATAALIGAAVTEGLAQNLRVKKKLE